MKKRSMEPPRRLTLAELGHLSCLLGEEQESGVYSGPREQYYARTERLMKWVSEQITELARNEQRDSAGRGDHNHGVESSFPPLT